MYDSNGSDTGAAVVLQRARKVVLHHWCSSSFREEFDEALAVMALKGIVNVAASCDNGVDLDTNPRSPTVTTNPDDGMTCFSCHGVSTGYFLGTARK